MIKRLCLLIVSLLTATDSFSQVDPNEDLLRSNGKIYVVVAVAAIVISVIGIYMISIDRKLTKLEKKLKEGSSHQQ